MLPFYLKAFAVHKPVKICSPFFITPSKINQISKNLLNTLPQKVLQKLHFNCYKRFHLKFPPPFGSYLALPHWPGDSLNTQGTFYLRNFVLLMVSPRNFLSLDSHIVSSFVSFRGLLQKSFSQWNFLRKL